MQATLSHKKISVQAERWLARTELPSGLSAADYLVLFRALREINSDLASVLFKHFLKCSQSSDLIQDTYAFQAVQATVIEVLETAAQSEETIQRYWPVLLSTHERLACFFDSKDRGILEWPTVSPTDFPNSIMLQSCHVQTTSALIDLAIRLTKEYRSLALDLDILIHEANHQLWDEATNSYRLNPGTTGSTTPNLTSPYLTLWAKIPNQEQAEELLIHLRSSTPPWTSPSSSAWVSSNSYLIYEGLLHYDMYQAAQELRTYLERHLSEDQDNWRTACISLCFAASSAV